MLKSKKLLYLFLSLVIVFSLFGCAQNADTQETTESNNIESAGTETGEPVVSGEPVNLVFWDMLSGRPDLWTAKVEELVGKFNETHPNINVEVQFIPWDNYYQQFLTAVTSGAAPDISTGAFPQSIQYAVMDEVVDLSSIVDEWKADGTYDDFMPGSIELHQYNGIQAGIPWSCDPRFITYRADIFKQAGIEKLPESWEEFIEVCRKIKANTDVIPFGIAAADQMSDHTILHFMLNNGIGICDKNIQSTFTDPKVIETLQLFDTLYKEELVSKGSASYKGEDLLALLQTGGAAMVFGSFPGMIYADPQAGPQLRVMPNFPSVAGKEMRVLNWINPMIVYKQTQYPEEAKVFVKWYIENNLSLFTEGGSLGYPVLNSFLQDDYYQNDPLAKDVVENILPYGVTPVWPAINLYSAFSLISDENYIGKALQEVLTGNDNLQDIVDKYDAKILEALEEAK